MDLPAGSIKGLLAPPDAVSDRFFPLRKPHWLPLADVFALEARPDAYAHSTADPAWRSGAPAEAASRLFYFKRPKTFSLHVSMPVPPVARPLPPYRSFEAQGLGASLVGNCVDVSRTDLLALGLRREVLIYSLERASMSSLAARKKPVCLRFSPDARYLLTADRQGGFRVFDGSRFQPLIAGSFVDRPVAVCFSGPFGALLVGQKGGIGRVDVREKGPARMEAFGGGERLRCAAFGAVGGHLACGDALGRVHFWDTRNWAGAAGAVTAHAGPVNAVAFSPFRGLLTVSASGGPAPSLALCHATVVAVSKQAACENELFDLVCSSAEEKLVAALGPGARPDAFALYGSDLQALGHISPAAAPGRKERALRLAAHPDGEKVAACYSTDVVQLWQLFSRQKRRGPLPLPMEAHKQLR